MAIARAIASGNWSATSTWNGGVLPGNGDTVYANGFTVTIDQNVDIGGANNPIVSAGSFVSGQWYEITTTGTTTFTSIGAAANTVGTIFQASGVGSGTGQARARATLTTAANAAAGATAGGGGFALVASYNIAADLRGGTTTVLTISSSANTTISSPIITAPSVNSPAISHGGTGTLTLTSGAVISSGNSGSNNNGIFISANGILVISGSIFNSGGNGAPILNGTSGSITINQSTISGDGQFTQPDVVSGGGSVTFNLCTIIGSSNVNGPAAVSNSSSGTINCLNTTITAGTVNPAIANSVSGAVSCVNCTFTAVNGIAAINSSNITGGNRFSGTFISSANGTQPINATRWILNSSPTVSYIQHALDGINPNSFVRFYTSDNSTALNQAAPTDVRSGVAYGIGNSQTGRLTVPARGSVALSVNYGPSMPFTATVSDTTATATLAYSYPIVVGDQITVTGASNSEWNSTYTIASVVSGTSVTFTVPNTHSATAGTGANMQTTGTAVLDPAAVASAVWGAASRTLTSASGPTAADNATAVWQAATRTLTAGAGITAADVWSHASRTVTGGTVDTLTNAPSVPTAAAIATQVWAVADKTGYSLTSAERTAIAAAVEASILAEGDGQAILNAIVTAIGNSNVDQVALVAAIRTDMERNGGNLAAIKAKTDNLPASPAATGDIPTESEIAAEVWAKPTTELTITGSIGERAKNQSTVSTTGAQLAAALS